MSDRTSAGLFASIFTYLAEKPDNRAKAFARELFSMTAFIAVVVFMIGIVDIMRAIDRLTAQVAELSKARCQ